MSRLTAPQRLLLEQGRQLAERSDFGLLVSGPQYRTAIALERKGLGVVRYQGPGMGWFTAPPSSVKEELHTN